MLKTTLARLIFLMMVTSLLLVACETPTPTSTFTPVPTIPSTVTPTPAPIVTTIIQDFESAIPAVIYPVVGAIAKLGDTAYKGNKSLESLSTVSGEWHTIGLELSTPMDFHQYQALCFYIYSSVDGDTVGINLIDHSGGNVERFTDYAGIGDNPKTKKDDWLRMCVNLKSFDSVDLTKIAKVEFTLVSSGIYYFDDLTLLTSSDAQLIQPQPTSTQNVQTKPFVQDFETDGNAFYPDFQAEVQRDTKVFHGGAASLRIDGKSGEWHSFGIYPAPRPYDASKFGRLCFWIDDTTRHEGGNAGNTVGVKLFDANGKSQEFYTNDPPVGPNPLTKFTEFTQMCVRLGGYAEIDLTKIDKIKFSLYWPGTYYMDDIGFQPAASMSDKNPGSLAVFQDFEAAERNFYADYQAEVSRDTGVFHSGTASLGADGASGTWHTFGVYPTIRPFNASGYGKFCFWIDDSTTHDQVKAGNSVGVTLFDAKGKKQEVWTDKAGPNPKTAPDQFVQMCIKLDAYPEIDLTQLDKIQFSLYWAGTYHIDDIVFEP